MAALLVLTGPVCTRSASRRARSRRIPRCPAAPHAASVVTLAPLEISASCKRRDQVTLRCEMAVAQHQNGQAGEDRRGHRSSTMFRASQRDATPPCYYTYGRRRTGATPRIPRFPPGNDFSLPPMLVCHRRSPESQRIGAQIESVQPPAADACRTELCGSHADEEVLSFSVAQPTNRPRCKSTQAAPPARASRCAAARRLGFREVRPVAATARPRLHPRRR